MEYNGMTISSGDTIAVPAWGHMRIETTFNVKHVKHNRVNEYVVICETRYFETGQPIMDVYSAQWIGDAEKTNDETLTEEGISDMFQEWIDR